MVSMLNQIRRLLMQPEVRRFVSFASAVVGLLCYALSSSFHHLFGKWSLWKICLYSIISIFFCLAILFSKSCRCPTNQAHLAFLVLTTTSVYSFLFDRAVNGKPDAYSLVSCAAFAIMSLSLSKQTHCGIEVDLLYFFCGFLMVQLMKLKLLLVIVGAGFSYSLIILRSSLDAAAETVHLVQVQDQQYVVLQIDSNSEETNTSSAIHVDSAPIMQENGDVGLQDRAITEDNSHSQQDNSYRDLTILETGTKSLAKVTWQLNLILWNQVKQYLNSKTQNQIPVRPYELPSGIIIDLCNTVKYVVAAGFETECRKLYGVLRSRFLNKCLSILGLQEVNLWEVEKKNIGSLIDAFNVVLKILFPFERGLWGRVFSGFYSAECNIFSGSDWRRIEIELWAKFLVLETRIRCDVGQAAFPSCEVHPITHAVMRCLTDVCKDRHLTSYSHVPAMIQLLENNLEAKSKNYKVPALGYLFMVNNGRHIKMMAKDNNLLPTLLLDDWNGKHTSNFEHFLGSSWNKVVEFLKLDSNESVAPNDSAESMKKKLNLFNQHFEEICRVQSRWFVIDEKLKEKMRRSLEEILLTAYENFIGRFQDVLGKHATEHIKYKKLDIIIKLHRLFRGSKRMSSGPKKKHFMLGNLISSP